MPSLVIPESGLSLGGFPGAASKAAAVPDVFGLTLTDAVIEEMIKCVQNGKGLQLSLGESPSISYGSKVQHLATSYDPFSHDFFQTTISQSDSDSDSSSADEMQHLKPSVKKGIVKVQPKICHSFLAGFGGTKANAAKFPELKAISKAAAVTTKTTSSTPTTSKTPSTTTGTDAALAQLQGALASEHQKKQANTTQIIDSLGVPRGNKAQKATNKSKFLTQNRSLASGTTRSMPSSPALNSVGSPSLGPTTVPLSQQNAEKAKAARKPIIHILAVEPLAEKVLRSKLSDVPENDFKNALQKVGDLNDSTGKWELRKSFWKELDVWTYKYDSGDRQRAIDNAVKQYDKMRLGVSEPEWDRLLIKAERGTGKSLSKLQAEIAAKGSLARSRNNSQNESSGRDTPNGEDDLFDDKNLSKVKGEGMARSASQPPTTKTKKVSEKEAQAKRLFSKNPNKPTAPKAAPKPASTKPATAKTSSAKAASTKKAASAPKAGTKVLSSEYVEDSDDEDDEQPPPPKVTKPIAKAATKRPREEDNETSDSSIPLSKKVKKDAPVTTTNHRVSDASQTSRTTTTNSTYSSFTASTKNKSNSPQKSSPLASSPPTNASDMESSSDRTSSSASPAPRFPTKKSRSPIHKRHQKSSSNTSSSSGGRVKLSQEVMEKSAAFKSYFPAYHKLYEEVSKMGPRAGSKYDDLLEMHDRLVKMRKDIQDMVNFEV